MYLVLTRQLDAALVTGDRKLLDLVAEAIVRAGTSEARTTLVGRAQWAVVVDQQALVEYRYRAVREVLGGAPIGEVAARYGTSRQSVHTWRKRFEAEGMVGLIGRSRRPTGLHVRLARRAGTGAKVQFSKATERGARV